MNELLLFIEIISVFSLVAIISTKGKKYLFAWIPVALILANLTVAKQVDFFGMQCPLGNVLFASTFLATDIISEKYGKAEAKKAINIGMVFLVFFILYMQFVLLYIPNELDIANDYMKGMYHIDTRMAIASVVMCYLANLADVTIYNKIKSITGSKYMWVRNNLSTAFCNSAENFGFMFIAFIGLMPAHEIMVSAIIVSVLEIVIALCDTPFLYLSVRKK